MDNVNSEYKILFVCLGNICRSPAAEGILKAKLDINGIKGCYVDSAGTGGYHIGDLPDIRMRKAAAQRGYSLTHRARKVNRSDFEDFDIIIGMDDNNVRDLRRMAATIDEEKKIVPISQWLNPNCGYDYVPDPYYEGREGFELTLDLLEMACNNIIEEFKMQK